jgi:hypothetical protein
MASSLDQIPKDNKKHKRKASKLDPTSISLSPTSISLSPNKSSTSNSNQEGAPTPRLRPNSGGGSPNMPGDDRKRTKVTHTKPKNNEPDILDLVQKMALVKIAECEAEKAALDIDLERWEITKNWYVLLLWMAETLTTTCGVTEWQSFGIDEAILKSKYEDVLEATRRNIIGPKPPPSNWYVGCSELIDVIEAMCKSKRSKRKKQRLHKLAEEIMYKLQ